MSKSEISAKPQSSAVFNSGNKASYSIDTFCEVHDISRAMLYRLWAEGVGPDFFYVGSKRLISQEAAARWRQEREAAAIAAE